MVMERLFVAIPLGEKQRELLERQQQMIQKSIPFQKWTHPQDLHITLKFLGETPKQVMEQIPAILERVSSTQCAFNLTLLGTFGKPAVPSILWAGVQGALPSLEALQKSVESALEPLGFKPEERGYNPHITLARRYQGSSSFTTGDLEPLDVLASAAEASWSASSMVLYRTHLGRKPSYEPVAAFPFK
ncbi:RNA 2',3'-cyclic phosphodiesterase [Paenibacillus rigui]|uniref:RNA 2',3'-cyclic phosphodiesterase n=1 Tax=Paenibacillus rigui TaxID=554312 RepID=A0A229UUM7_9BACL|nr:RNA 2',3'-cyclic phosphodiesterase [Paenibacillus rigui]OXM86619.1 RNA 2',3'-cyclic phosphodiesterase [Paenibacillus rigui]